MTPTRLPPKPEPAPAPSEGEIERAARALRAGQLVVFPTETVYGLGANALDRAAVARIFQAKGRPADNPLIVHITSEAAARALTSTWPEAAAKLARAFWPGPLTLVLPRASHVPDITTAGLDTVAVRVPDHATANALLTAARVPIAAPSANRSGRPSPTRVADARHDLGDAVAAYLDAGPARVGIESTVVAVEEDGRVTLLRPGGIPRSDLEAVVGPLAHDTETHRIRSPGTKYRHYAPRARVRLAPAERLEEEARRLEAEGLSVAIVASRESAPAASHVRVPGARADAAAWAHELFALLRDLDAEGFDAVVVEELPEDGLGEAVMNRLRKAAEPQ